MFIGIPLLFIFLSIAGIFFIVFRKLSSFRDIVTEPQDINRNQSVFQDFFPELFLFVHRLNIKKAIQTGLCEIEKILRKLRLAILATERLSDRLIHRIRRVQKVQLGAGSEDGEQLLNTREEVIAINNEPSLKTSLKDEVVKLDNNFIKPEEQRLIDAITQNPKDVELYKALGEVYLKAENWADAKESFKAAMRLRPSDRDLAQKLSLVLEKLLQK